MFLRPPFPSISRERISSYPPPPFFFIRDHFCPLPRTNDEDTMKEKGAEEFQRFVNVVENRYQEK